MIPQRYRVLVAAICVVIIPWPCALAQNLSDDQVSLVEARLAEGAKQAWELGTRAQALTEYHASLFSVLSAQPIPPPSTIPGNLTSAMTDILGIAKAVVSNRSTSNGGISGPQPFIKDSSAADPVSNGVAILLANWTGKGASDGLDYAGAAKDQLDYLYNVVPKTTDGAWSHRIEQVQLWSDFVYMVPPFLAYYGVLTANQTLLSEAYNQISLYRSYLRDSGANNLWKHVQLGVSANDDGHWATGNGWAAAGMLRVLGTIQQSPYSKQMKNQQKDLASWIGEIHDGMYDVLDSNWLFKNYPDQDLSATNFYDGSSTALMTSTVYRFSLIWGVHKHLPLAEESRKALSAAATSSALRARQAPSSSVSRSESRSGSSSETRSRAETSFTQSSSIPQPDPSSANNSTVSQTRTSTSIAPSPTPSDPAGPLEHFSANGWLTPVVNPHSYGKEGAESPEGQAFVLEMQAAWRDWVAAGSPGANGSMRNAGVGWAWALVLIAGAVLQWSV